MLQKIWIIVLLTFGLINVFEKDDLSKIERWTFIAAMAILMDFISKRGL